MPGSRELFLALLGAVAVERLVELGLSTRNARRAAARGGIEAESRRFYALMVGLHVAFFVAAPLEVLLARRPFLPWLGGPMLALVALSMALRYWAIATLGERWNTRVVRHPNYVAVALELLALPLVHTAWLTAIVFSLLNAALLARRIAHEEAALALHADYRARLGDRPRFVPGAP
jgi:methyltransferase